MTLKGLRMALSISPWEATCTAGRCKRELSQREHVTRVIGRDKHNIEKNYQAGYVVAKADRKMFPIYQRMHNVRSKKHMYHNTRCQGKPNIVAIMGQLGVVTSVHVAGHQSDLKRTWCNKIRKYVGDPDVNQITYTVEETKIIYLKTNLCWEALWYNFLSHGTVHWRELAVIATRFLKGWYICHRVGRCITT